MSFFKNIKEFIHNVTTSDHYAQYDAPTPASRNRASSPLHGLGVSRQSGSQVSLHNNVSTVSLSGQNRPSTSESSSNVNLTGLNNANRSSTTIPYRPGMRSQLNNDSQIELRNYENGQPVRNVGEMWDKIDDWLDREFPELGDDLQGGATSNDLNAFEIDLEINLPSAFRESYQIHDGQISMGKTRGLIYTYPLMDLESIAAETNIWRKVYRKYEQKSPELIFSTFGVQRSCPPRFVRETYYDPMWVPFVKDNVGNNIALDLNPAEAGKWGQVILYGRDYNVAYVVADSFSEFLSNLSDELENGLYDIDEDEDLNYVYKGKTYNYFDVLKLKSIARAKKLNPNFTLDEKKLNDADLLVKKPRSRNNKEINIKKSTPSVSAAASTATSPALPKSSKIGDGSDFGKENEQLTEETIIAPVYPAGKERDFTPSKENIATNDSFVIDEDVSDTEEQAVVEPTPVEDVAKGVEDFKVEEPIAEMVAPVAEKVEEPVIIEEPLVEEPLVEEPLVEEPLVEEPLVEGPLVEEAVNEETVNEKAVNEEAVNEEIQETEETEEADDTTEDASVNATPTPKKKNNKKKKGKK